MAFGNGPKIVTNGLVLLLDAADKNSYPGSGTTWTDISGNGNNGTLTNGPTFNSANGGSIVFDGIDDYSTIPSSPSWAIGTNGTLEMVIYRAASITTNHRLWCVTNNSSNLDAYLDNATGGVYMHGGVIGTNAQPPLNQYLHVLVTYNSGTIAMYYNGISQTLSGTSTGYNITGTGTLFIAQFYAGGSYYFNGRIPSFKIYNRALSATEILQNYNATKSRFGLT